MLTFLNESIAACAVFTLLVFCISWNPVKFVFNYPPAIIERCKDLGLVDDSNRRWGPGFIIVKLGALVLDCIWFCHGKRFIIPGTEDMKEAYHDYRFHIKGALIGMLLLVPLALIAGLVTVCL